MESLIIPSTKTTPAIEFNEAKAHFKITGRSIPADATTFYSQIDRWAEKCVAQFEGSVLQIDIILDHLNTGSVRSILTLLSRFLRLKSKGGTVVINWHYEHDDEDIRDKGEEMALILGHPFVFKSYDYPIG